MPQQCRLTTGREERVRLGQGIKKNSYFPTSSLIKPTAKFMGKSDLHRKGKTNIFEVSSFYLLFQPQKYECCHDLSIESYPQFAWWGTIQQILSYKWEHKMDGFYELQ